MQHEKEVYQAILANRPVKPIFVEALKRLTGYLYRHHGVKPIILIDEYDTPIQSGYIHGYYDDVIGLFRHFLGRRLKRQSLFI